MKLRTAPIWTDVAIQELTFLQREVVGGRISYHHPRSGPVQTDDFSDVISNTVSLLLRYHSGDKELRQLMRKSGFGPIRLQSSIMPQKGASLPGYGGAINKIYPQSGAGIKRR